MRGVVRPAAVWSAAICLIAGATLLGQQPTKPTATPAVAAKPNPVMNGLWDYNDELSVDAATGQRERAPLANGQRARSSPAGPIATPTTPPPTGTATGAGTAGVTTGSPGTTGSTGTTGSAGTTGTTGTAGSTGTTGTTGPAGSAVPTSSTGGGAPGTTITTTGGLPPMGAAGGSIDDFERSTRDLFMTERHDLVRDLLEIPELLRVRVTDEGVTFVDDLQRLRTYLTNGKLAKYQLGAAQFQARAYWDALGFHKDIEGAGNFKMTELYHVSESGNQLVVEIRVGDPKKPATMVGVNRVYDRVGR